MTLLLLLPPSQACTTFCIPHEDGWIFGSNLDWMVEDGMVVVNKRGVAKTAYHPENPARWVSRYGSVTFNQYGRELPMGGMNEAGLILDNMWLEETEYPSPEERGQLGCLQWIQYQLDISGSVAEVVHSGAVVGIDPSRGRPLHFLVCDRQGGCAVIEFLAGEMTVHMGDELPVTALTNNTYAESCRFLERCGGDESSLAFRAAGMSLRRFKWAADGVAGYEPGKPGTAIAYAFGILKEVTVARTRWSIVYDSRERRVYFRTRTNPAVRHLDLAGCDFSCHSPVRVLDMASGEPGDATPDLATYSIRLNRDLIDRTFSKTPFLQNVSEDSRRWLARYPETLDCVR